MTHRIYKAICTVAVVVFLCSLALIMELLYNYFSAVHLKQMKELAGMTARGVELNGNSFFDDFSFDGCRITWIQSDGEVLFDNEANADHMENHLEREEVREAMTTGEGESSRYSKTLTERYVYVATALDDGSVIRIADTQYSVLTLLLGSMQPILIVLAIGLGLSFYLAWKLSKRIVKPLNEMDLDHPDEKLVYEELAPLVKRLNSQQRQISIQRSDLQRKRDEFEAATSHMSEGIILLDEKGSILSINASARRILKATPYSFAGDSATAASNLMAALSGALAAQASTAAASARSIGTAITSGIASGIRSGQSAVIQAAIQAARSALSAAKAALAIHSPSAIFRDEVGLMAMKGMGEGFLEGQQEQAKIIRNAARFLTEEAQGGIVAGSTHNDNRQTWQQQSSVNLTGNSFYIRSDRDIHDLAVEIATLTRTQQRGRGLRMA